MSEQESPKTARKSPAKAESPSPELLARRKQALTVYVGPANPDLKKLFVPVEELAETRCQLRKEGSGMHRLFKTINEASRKARKAKE